MKIKNSPIFEWKMKKWYKKSIEIAELGENLFRKASFRN